MTLVGVAVRNMAHNKVRVVLTILAIGVSMFAFLLIQTVLASWKNGGQNAVKDRVVGYRTTNGMLPISYMEGIRSQPHVKAATYAVFFDGHDPAHPSSFFATAAVDADTYLDVYPDIILPPDQVKAWKEDRSGALIGDLLAQSMGWKIGDRITLETPRFVNEKGQPWAFTVRGIYTSKTKTLPRKYMSFHYSALNDGLPARSQNQFEWYTALVDNASNTPAVADSVDHYFEDKEYPTRSMDEETFRTSIFAGASTIQTAMEVVSLLLLGLTMLVLGNTISMGVYERTREYGALRALGFMPRHVTTFIVTEGAFIGLLGGIVGCAAAVGVVEGFLKKLVSDEMPNFFPSFSLPVTSAVLGILIAFGAGLLASALPARRAGAMSVVDALRRVA